jgi:hypothetical protein
MGVTFDIYDRFETVPVSFSYFQFGIGFQATAAPSFVVNPTTDYLKMFVNESANDGSPEGAYLGLVSALLDFNSPDPDVTGFFDLAIDIPTSFFEAHVGTTITYELVLTSFDLNTQSPDGQAIAFVDVRLLSDNPEDPPVTALITHKRSKTITLRSRDRNCHRIKPRSKTKTLLIRRRPKECLWMTFYRRSRPPQFRR